MDDLLREFLTETSESLETVDNELVRFEQEPNNARILGNIFRLVHTIKGTCGFIGLPRLEALAHAAETLLGKIRDGMPATRETVTLILAAIDRIKEILRQLEATQTEPPGGDTDLIADLERMATQCAAPNAAGTSTPPPAPRRAPGRRESADKSTTQPRREAAAHSLRVHVDTLEHLMTMVSELVLTRNQLLEIARRHEESEYKSPLQRLSAVTAELQDGVMKTRMQPIGHAWQKLPRIVRDLAAELDKDIELQMFGAETELDRQVLDLVRDPLTHMVRNAADHGLEPPAERRARGKPEKGTIRLSACHEGGHIVIEIADDGRGLNTERIKAKAVAAGLVAEADAEKMSEAQLQKFIFLPGFSTAQSITSISGRGVGMDVVKNNIDQIGGAVDVCSVPGAGTSFTIKIPLTLAIVAALIVEAGGERFAIPQLAVVELVRAAQGSDHRIERIRDAPLLRLRHQLLPLVQLSSLLGLDAKAQLEDGFIIVAQVGSRRFGIVVDALFHTEEIVVKPMASMLRHIGMFSGTTILGDGAVILILDPNGVAEAVGAVDSAAAAANPSSAVEESGAGAATSLLVFRAGSPELKAAPLSLITRLEEIDCASIERANGRAVVQYRGQLMPLVPAAETCVARSAGAQPLLVFGEAGRCMGLIVDEIVDIVEERLTIELSSDAPGVLGSAVVKGKATAIIDIGHFLPLAFGELARRGAGQRGAPKPRLLLVDDSAFFRNLLPPLLQAAGYDVTTASGAQEALGLLAQDQVFEAVLSDLDMPEIDGFELARAILSDERRSAIPLIALSAHASAELFEHVRHAGFHDLVAKFDRPGLIAALKRLTEWDKAA